LNVDRAQAAEEEVEEGEIVESKEKIKGKGEEKTRKRVFDEDSVLLTEEPADANWREFIRQDGGEAAEEIREALETVLAPTDSFDCFDVSMTRRLRAKILNRLDASPEVWHVPKSAPSLEGATTKSKNFERMVMNRQREQVQILKAIQALIFNGYVGNEEGVIVTGAQAILLLSHLMSGENKERERVRDGIAVVRRMQETEDEPLHRPGQMEALQKNNEKQKELQTAAGDLFPGGRRFQAGGFGGHRSGARGFPRFYKKQRTWSAPPKQSYQRTQTYTPSYQQTPQRQQTFSSSYQQTPTQTPKYQGSDQNQQQQHKSEGKKTFYRSFQKK
jgi:hypothetical protein